MARLPSVTSKRTLRFSPRARVPGLTRPPSRMRAPDCTCFSATSVGELKNTIESLSALKTSAAATVSTARPQPINTRRRCLRVIDHRAAWSLGLQRKRVHQFLEATHLVGVGGERLAGVEGGGARIVPLAQHTIGAHEPEPALDIGAVALQALGEPRDHAAHHLAALLRRELGGRGHILFAGSWTGLARTSFARLGTSTAFEARQRMLDVVDPRRARRRLGDKIAPDRGGLGALSVLVRGAPDEEAR